MADTPNTPKAKDLRPSACALGSDGHSLLDDDSCPALLRALLDHIPALAYAKDEDHRWVFFNKEFQLTFDLPAEELRGRVDVDVLPKAVAAWVREQDEAVLRTGLPVESEIQVNWQGRSRAASSYKRLWTDPHSGRRYLLGFITDVSSHFHIQQKHETTLSIVGNGPAILVRCRLEPELPIDYISGNIWRFGYHPGDLPDQISGLTELIHPDDSERIVEEADRLMRGGHDSFLQQYRIRTSLGDVRWVEDYVFIERDAHRNALYRQGFLLDVTDRHEAVNALAASEARYRTLAENFPDGMVVMFDRDMRYTLAEGQGLRHLGLSQEKLLGKTIWEAFSSGTAEQLAERYGAALRGQKSLFEMTHADHHFEVRIIPVRNQEGGITGGMVVCHDITRRKEAENALADLNANLEQLVGKRTRTLARQARDLEEANRQLRKLDELKSSFLSAVSHELRTPLTSIFGFTKLINKDLARHLRPLVAECEDPTALTRLDRVLENLAVIEQEGARLTRLINDVLDLTRIESGRMEWRDARIKIADCIYEAVLSVSGQFFENDDLQLEADVPKELPDVIADPDRIVQVIVNLLGNAAKFTRRGMVRIRARRVDDEIAVFVTDTGSGIDTCELERIFDKFHQTRVGDTLFHAKPGSGLGLAICRDIVDRYGGRIWVRSRPGSGSVFTFTIPIAPEEEASCT